MDPIDPQQAVSKLFFKLFPPSLYPFLYSPSSYPEFSLFYRLILPMALFHHSMLA